MTSVASASPIYLVRPGAKVVEGHRGADLAEQLSALLRAELDWCPGVEPGR